MRIAAYQAPLLPSGSMEGIALIRKQIDWCEANDVAILCCPEAILGGLADNATQPSEFALGIEDGSLHTALAPLASNTVSAIVGFTEIAADHLYNSAVVFHQGNVLGVYRKQHPAIRRSVYRAGATGAVFRIADVTFGVLICNDSNFPDIARAMVAQKATVLFIPTNNGLPPEKADVVNDANNVDVACATENDVFVLRADVAGRAANLMSYGSSIIVAPGGRIVRSGRRLDEDLLVVDLDNSQHRVGPTTVPRIA